MIWACVYEERLGETDHSGLAKSRLRGDPTVDFTYWKDRQEDGDSSPWCQVILQQPHTAAQAGPSTSPVPRKVVGSRAVSSERQWEIPPEVSKTRLDNTVVWSDTSCSMQTVWTETLRPLLTNTSTSIQLKSKFLRFFEKVAYIRKCWEDSFDDPIHHLSNLSPVNPYLITRDAVDVLERSINLKLGENKRDVILPKLSWEMCC